jgi:hypothetical protein
VRSSERFDKKNLFSRVEQHGEPESDDERPNYKQNLANHSPDLLIPKQMPGFPTVFPPALIRV